jgi:Dolichyl-phosphate-mannose-protein mannosyltransferase
VGGKEVIDVHHLHTRGAGERSQNSGRPALWLFLVALAVRLAFLLFSPNNGNDAWLRYLNALFWAHHPTQLPPDADIWLPLHFWLLGAMLRLHSSQELARLFTAFLGAVTVMPFWGVVRRAFCPRVALASTIALALFGFHIAYSITTSSEAPTIFFLAIALYGWVRLCSEGTILWGIAGGLALSAASLCRFEPWVAVPVLSVLLLDFSGGWSSLLADRTGWIHLLCFAAPASAGSMTWTIFSWLKWNDPLAVAHHNMLLTATIPVILRHSLPFRLAVVPGSLLMSLDPLILILAAVGLVVVLAHGSRAMDCFQARHPGSACIPSLRSGRALPASLPGARQVELRPGPPERRRYAPETGASGSSLARSIAILGMILAGTDYFNAVVNQTTQARFTLIYSWLLLPFAFEALEWLVARYSARGWHVAYAAVAAFFLFWEGGIIVGAAYAPPAIADRLGVMSPSLPLRRELRNLTTWLRQHVPSSSAVIVDSLDYDAGDISRFAGFRTADVFQVRNNLVNRAMLKRQISQFLELRHPRFLVCAPQGPLCAMWRVDGHEVLDVQPEGIRLRREWKGSRWRVYEISYPPLG